MPSRAVREFFVVDLSPLGGAVEAAMCSLTARQSALIDWRAQWVAPSQSCDGEDH
jgi:hypothetical protein